MDIVIEYIRKNPELITSGIIKNVECNKRIAEGEKEIFCPLYIETGERCVFVRVLSPQRVSDALTDLVLEPDKVFEEFAKLVGKTKDHVIITRRSEKLERLTEFVNKIGVRIIFEDDLIRGNKGKYKEFVLKYSHLRLVDKINSLLEELGPMFIEEFYPHFIEKIEQRSFDDYRNLMNNYKWKNGVVASDSMKPTEGLHNRSRKSFLIAPISMSGKTIHIEGVGDIHLPLVKRKLRRKWSDIAEAIVLQEGGYWTSPKLYSRLKNEKFDGHLTRPREILESMVKEGMLKKSRQRYSTTSGGELHFSGRHGGSRSYIYAPSKEALKEAILSMDEYREGCDFISSERVTSYPRLIRATKNCNPHYLVRNMIREGVFGIKEKLETRSWMVGTGDITEDVILSVEGVDDQIYQKKVDEILQENVQISAEKVRIGENFEVKVMLLAEDFFIRNSENIERTELRELADVKWRYSLGKTDIDITFYLKDELGKKTACFFCRSDLGVRDFARLNPWDIDKFLKAVELKHGSNTTKYLAVRSKDKIPYQIMRDFVIPGHIKVFAVDELTSEYCRRQGINKEEFERRVDEKCRELKEKKLWDESIFPSLDKIPLKFGEFVGPMCVTIFDENPVGPFFYFNRDVIAQAKVDGWRGELHKSGKELVIFTKKGKKFSFPERCRRGMLEALAQFDSAILDVEVVPVAQGAILNREHVSNRDVDKRVHVIDALMVDGQNLLVMPLEHRLNRVQQIKENEYLQPIMTKRINSTKDLSRFYAGCLNTPGVHGIVVKRRGSLYYPRRRSLDWKKVRPAGTNEIKVVVVGFNFNEKIRKVKTLVVACRENAFRDRFVTLRRTGNLGTMASDRILPKLRMIEIARKSSKVDGGKSYAFDGATTNWVRPELIVRVGFNKLRQVKGSWYPHGLDIQPLNFKGLEDSATMNEVPTVEELKEIAQRRPYPSLIFDFDVMCPDDREDIEQVGIVLDELLNKGVKIFIVSSQYSREEVAEKLRAAGLEEYFAEDMVWCLKSRAELIGDLAKKKSMDMSNLVYVGKELEDLGEVSDLGVGMWLVESMLPTSRSSVEIRFQGIKDRMEFVRLEWEQIEGLLDAARGNGNKKNSFQKEGYKPCVPEKEES